MERSGLLNRRRQGWVRKVLAHLGQNARRAPWISLVLVGLATSCFALFCLQSQPNKATPAGRATLGYPAHDILGTADGSPILRAGTFSVPSIFDPSFIAPTSPRLGKTPETTMLAQEPVLGIQVNSDIRAYSTWFMNAREVVHDEVGGKALLITW